MKYLNLVLLASAQMALSAAEFNVGGHTFTLPDGFTIELVANAPLVDRPIEADFDEEGRLYVTDSSGSNDKPDKQLIDKPHRVMRLEDSDGDGRFDKTVVFADKMMFPEGAMWLKGSLYVSAPPSIWKLTDTNGDGVADKREEWFNGQTLTGCANDLHGPYAGPDGWIYWAKGAFAKQTHERSGQAPIITRASHIFRARPDGSGLEIVMTGGMDNPVGIAFSETGERFFTCTFIQHPEGGKRDALVHAIYGGVYGKVNDVVDDHPQTGDLMPVMTHLGAAAPAGVIRYESEVIGREFRNNFFVCNFNMHKITRHIPSPDGATYKTANSDFLVAADTDFHPTDILEDADGSILVIDTGGWYKLCCPTSQLAKPDVLGAIYRIRKTGAKTPEDPRGKKLDWSLPMLSTHLGDPRPAVNKRAIAELAKRGESAVSSLSPVFRNGNALAKQNALWVLAQVNHPSARALSRYAFNNNSTPETRMMVAHQAALYRDAAAKPTMIKMLSTGSPAEKRVAAEALGRLTDESVIAPILEAAKGELDRPLEHALAYALIEIGKPAPLRTALQEQKGNAQKIALIALSQITNGLTAQDIGPFLTGANDLRKTAEWIAIKHPAWGSEIAEILKDQKDLENYEALLARLSGSPAIQNMLSTLCETKPVVALRAMERSGLKKAPDAWNASVARLARSNDAAVQKQAIATARALSTKDAALREALQEIADDAIASTEIRLAALRSLPEGTSISDSAFSLVLANLGPDARIELRSDAVAAATRAKLNDEQRLKLTDALGAAGPMELPRLFTVFEKQTDEATGLRLVAALRKSTVLVSLPPDWADQRLAKFPESVREAAKALPRSEAGDAAGQRKHLEELAAELKGGDIRRGQAIFNSAKAACVSCHAIGYLGGKIGPDLTSIGQVRTHMDLLESIVYPSASFVRSYEPVLVQTKDGEAHTGILRGDTDEGVLLVTGPNAEERIAREKIAAMRPGAVSIMPAGLESQLSKEELADLVAFLKGTKWGPN